MTDDLLTSFRSELPLPDEATTQRIYERATSGRRHRSTRPLVATVAVLTVAAIAASVSATLGGEASKPPADTDQGRGGTQSFEPYAQNLYTFNRDGQMLTSIAVTVRDQN